MSTSCNRQHPVRSTHYQRRIVPGEHLNTIFPLPPGHPQIVFGYERNRRARRHHSLVPVASWELVTYAPIVPIATQLGSDRRRGRSGRRAEGTVRLSPIAVSALGSECVHLCLIRRFWSVTRHPRNRVPPCEVQVCQLDSSCYYSPCSPSW